MKSFFALLGLSFKSLLINSTNVGRRGKNGKARSGTASLLILCAVFLYLSGMYSFMLAQSFAPVGGLDIMLALMITMAVFWPLIFVLFAAQSLVFSTKDVDLVLSLPVSSFSVMLARVLALYLETLLMCELMLIPAGVAYVYYGGAGGIGVLLMLLLLGVFLALIPTLIALLFGSVVALVVSRLPFKNLFTVILSLLLMVLIMASSFALSYMSNTTNPAESMEGLRASLFAIAPLYWSVRAAMGHIGLFLAVAGLCAAPFFGVVWVFSRFYKSILTRLGSHKMRNDYKVRSLKTQSAFAALFAKENKRFFGTPAYLLNAGIGVLMILILCIVAALNEGRIDGIIVELFGASAAIYNLLLPILLGIMVLMTSFIFVSSVSISLEGKTLWILKEAPVSTGQIFAAKVGLNFMLCAVTGLVGIPLLAYAFSIPLLEASLMLAVCLLFGLLTSALGLFINLLFPRMDAENETIVIKQSASVLLSMLANQVLLGLFVGLFFVVRGWGFVPFALLSAVLLVGLNGGVIALLAKKGTRLFAQL